MRLRDGRELHGVTVEFEYQDDNQVIACWPNASLFAIGETADAAYAALCDEVARFIADVHAASGSVAGAFAAQWAVVRAALKEEA